MPAEPSSSPVAASPVIGRPQHLQTTAAAIGLLVATLVGFFIIMSRLSQLGRESGGEARSQEVVVGLSSLVLGFVLAMPGVLWFRRRRTTWELWQTSPQHPLLAWGPRVMVVCGFLVANGVLDALFVLGQLRWMRSPADWSLTQWWGNVSVMVMAAWSAVCLVGLTASDTPERLWTWTQRALWLVLACALLPSVQLTLAHVEQAMRHG